ncbi:hypothetical protein ACFYNN_28620 [Streptomyces sp. NPDC006978]|uniref:hypothetical protein n=1 Tax=unclassified Streptomyces TaxID=2593676 RepID=UPI002AFFFF4C|nr:hypothetical protein [Streptomyces sp. S584]
MVDLISHIGGAEAVPHARDWALATPGLGPTLMNCWDRYPAEAYAAEVLSRLDTTRLRVRVRSRDQLAALSHVPDAAASTSSGTCRSPSSVPPCGAGAHGRSGCAPTAA